MPTHFSRPSISPSKSLGGIRHFFRNLTPKRFVWLVIGLIVVWLSLGVFRAAIKPETLEEPPLATVQVMPSSAKPVQGSLNFYGTLQAFSKVELRVRDESKVESLPAQEGRLLKKGDIIAILDMRDYERKLEEAQANLKKMQIENEAAEVLFKKSLTSKAKLSEAKAALGKAKAAVLDAEHHYQGRKIRAPADGVLDKFAAEVGDVLDPMGGNTKIADFIVSGAMSVVFYVPETQIDAIQIGQSAEITTAIGHTHPAEVVFVGTIADTATRTFRVEMTLQAHDAALHEGMTAGIRLHTGLSLAHRIPSSVLCLSDDGKLGVKLLENDVIAFYPVTLLQQTHDAAEVQGLPDKADIVVLGFASVVPGEKVQAMPVANPWEQVDATSH